MNFTCQEKRWTTFFAWCFAIFAALIIVIGIYWLICASVEIGDTDTFQIVGCRDQHHWLYHFRFLKYLGLMIIPAIITTIKNYKEHLYKAYSSTKVVEMSFKHSEKLIRLIPKDGRQKAIVVYCYMI